MNSLHIQTPQIHSRALSVRTGMEVFLKMEALQPSGSFKLRGIGQVCVHQAQLGKTRFVSSSGGNAGIAVAYAGRQLGIPVTVVVPTSTSLHAIELIRRENAQVIVHGPTWIEANEMAQSMLDHTTAFVHPFDNPDMWDGHASMVDEVVQSGLVFDAVILSVGGGGLLSGVAAGLNRLGLQHIPIVAVETHGADSFYQSVQAGERITLPEITSIATSLGAKQVCENAFNLTKTMDIRCQRVDDQEVKLASQHFLYDHRIWVEPACGASLAVLYDDAQTLSQEFKAPLVIVCGGVTAPCGVPPPASSKKS